ncbi:hypothetical protein C8R47DRAFT_1294176 [Mycena vitilis]|nr:hypothetical protein C8R47DRAFT_1294176 [Mycena vitilis]
MSPAARWTDAGPRRQCARHKHTEAARLATARTRVEALPWIHDLSGFNSAFDVLLSSNVNPVLQVHRAHVLCRAWTSPLLRTPSAWHPLDYMAWVANWEQRQRPVRHLGLSINADPRCCPNKRGLVGASGGPSTQIAQMRRGLARAVCCFISQLRTVARESRAAADLSLRPRESDAQPIFVRGLFDGAGGRGESAQGLFFFFRHEGGHPAFGWYRRSERRMEVWMGGVLATVMLGACTGELRCIHKAGLGLRARAAGRSGRDNGMGTEAGMGRMEKKRILLRGSSDTGVEPRVDGYQMASVLELAVFLFRVENALENAIGFPWLPSF